MRLERGFVQMRKGEADALAAQHRADARLRIKNAEPCNSEQMLNGKMRSSHC